MKTKSLLLLFKKIFEILKMKKLLFKAMYITNPCEKSEQKVGHLRYEIQSANKQAE